MTEILRDILDGFTEFWMMTARSAGRVLGLMSLIGAILALGFLLHYILSAML